MRRLRVMDNMMNQERERKNKQESQDFWLKKEFVKNAFNQEASFTASQMINTSKLMSSTLEIDAVHKSRPTQVLKTKKPDQIILEVRSKKIAELNQYKEQPTEKKYLDIQNLLGQMNTHGRLPKSLLAQSQDHDKANN